MAQCECGQIFANARQLGPHKRHCRGVVIHEPVHANQAGPAMGTAVPIPAATNLFSLAQRDEATKWVEHRPAPNGLPAPTPTPSRDVSALQMMWEAHVKKVHACCSTQFWQTMKTVYQETQKTRDAVLTLVKKFMPSPRRWPGTTRTLDRIVRKKAGLFWSNVTETHCIDLSQYGIASCKSVNFSFTDPIFAWTQCCNALHSSGHELHWAPKVMYHPRTHEPVYGAGIQYGLLMRSAAASIPEEGKPALISMSWDGGMTGYGNRNTVPICIQVMNVNSASPAGVGVLGYMPHVQVPAALSQTRAVILARHHVQQVTKMITYMLFLPAYMSLYEDIHTFHICCFYLHICHYMRIYTRFIYVVINYIYVVI